MSTNDKHTTTELPNAKDTPSSLRVHTKDPFNAEPKSSNLVDYDVTPEHLIYARNHGPISYLDDQTFKVSVRGLEGRDEVQLTLEQLKKGFEKTTVVAALQVRLLYCSNSGCR